MPTPLADSYHEEVDLEISGCLPLTEHLEDSLLGILVLHGRALRAFGPADHVLHWHSPRLSRSSGSMIAVNSFLRCCLVPRRFMVMIYSLPPLLANVRVE